MEENQYFILVPKGYGLYAELCKENVFYKGMRNGIVVYDLVKHISTKSYYTHELSIEFRRFLIVYAEREGITIDEVVLDNSIEPEVIENKEFIDEIYISCC